MPAGTHGLPMNLALDPVFYRLLAGSYARLLGRKLIPDGAASGEDEASLAHGYTAKPPFACWRITPPPNQSLFTPIVRRSSVSNMSGMRSPGCRPAYPLKRPTGLNVRIC